MWKNNIASGDYEQDQRKHSGIKIHRDINDITVFVDYYGNLDEILDLIHKNKTSKNYFISTSKDDIDSIDLGVKSRITPVALKSKPLSSVIYTSLGLGLKDKPYYYCSFH